MPKKYQSTNIQLIFLQAMAVIGCIWSFSIADTWPLMPPFLAWLLILTSFVFLYDHNIIGTPKNKEPLLVTLLRGFLCISFAFLAWAAAQLFESMLGTRFSDFNLLSFPFFAGFGAWAVLLGRRTRLL